ncbi:hypothetical protein [Cellulosimicrobium sp. Marseille-Q4280]|jgi:hypothetical protein|uniref:hypothetical protein n=1 Tax=Cellulosimicrobium sp. Marseille-Q4280 TaxID=2937992 RepID=UPI00203D9CE9|nr:hypothetical protein [Cellulosimicrobium sp. Marseille-Q4280]
MSESDEQGRGYDPGEDPDADPRSLNPRVGEGAQDTDDGGDPDADPANLNPRSGGEASGDDGA